MRKPVALRIQADLLDTARARARQDNRTLTDFIETALRDRIARMRPGAHAGGAPAAPPNARGSSE